MIRISGWSLQFWKLSISEEPLAATKITVRNNGSIRIEGDFEIVDSEGGVFDLAGRTTIGLCRCGHSENKPFCDGSHRKAEFQSEIKARALPPPVPKPPTT
jgi:CDGSH-type Zn-finger protein